ncbi:hypothetical protein FRB90_003737 [Tulasnella sp. 427]|nr:hypothetical protein FRB90_003737 [Tulasnella sp. 427]
MKATKYQFSIVVAALASAVAAAPAITAIDPPPTCAMIYGAPILALSDFAAINYLQLTNEGMYFLLCHYWANSPDLTRTIGGVAKLTDSGYHPQWDFTGGGIGVSGCVKTTPWLTIGTANSPRKPLYWTTTEITTSWDAAYFKNITAKATSRYSATSSFLACQPRKPAKSNSGIWTLYLLTDGSTGPTGPAPLYDVAVETCAETQLFVEPIRG